MSFFVRKGEYVPRLLSDDEISNRRSHIKTFNDSVLGPKQKKVNQEFFDNLNYTVNQNSLPKDLTLYRGITLPSSSFGVLKPGSVIPSYGTFHSTSTDPSVANQFSQTYQSPLGEVSHVFQIQAPKGFPAYKMGYKGNDQQFSSENEYLLPRETGFKVLNSEDVTPQGDFANPTKVYLHTVEPFIDPTPQVPDRKQLPLFKTQSFFVRKAASWKVIKKNLQGDAVHLTNSFPSGHTGHLTNDPDTGLWNAEVYSHDDPNNPKFSGSFNTAPLAQKVVENYVGSQPVKSPTLSPLEIANRTIGPAGSQKISDYNRSLWDPGNSRPVDSDFFDRLDNTIYQNPSAAPKDLYRGINLFSQQALDQYGNLKPGDVVTQPGFSSFSERPEVAHAFANAAKQLVPVVLKMKAQKGFPALPMPEYNNGYMQTPDGSPLGLEAEHLLPRGTSFKVTKSESVPNPYQGRRYSPTMMVHTVQPILPKKTTKVSWFVRNAWEDEYEYDPQDEPDFNPGEHFNSSKEPKPRILTDDEISNRGDYGNGDQAISAHNDYHMFPGAAPVDDKFFDSLNMTIHNSPLPAGRNLYRGITVPKTNPFHDQIHSLQNGDTFPSVGFCSTSTDPAVANRFSSGGDAHILHIQAPKGFPAYQMQYPGSDAVHEFENEYVLPRETKFQVTGHEYQPGAGHLWHLKPFLPDQQSPGTTAKKAFFIRGYIESDQEFDPANEPTPRLLTDSEVSNRNVTQGISNYNKWQGPSRAKLDNLSIPDDKFMDSLDMTVHNSQTPHAMTVYRGTYAGPYSPNNDFYANLKPGDSFTRPGFTSTSTSPMATEEYAPTADGDSHHLEIRLDKGFPAYQMPYVPGGRNEQFSSEQEMLLPRNTQFHVTDHDYDPDTGRHTWGLTATPPAKPDFSGRQYNESGHALDAKQTGLSMDKSSANSNQFFNDQTPRLLTDDEISNRGSGDTEQSIQAYNRSLYNQGGDNPYKRPLDHPFYDSLDMTIHNSPAPHDLTVYRGMHLSPDNPLYQQLQNAKDGDTFTSPGFSSASLNPHEATTFSSPQRVLDQTHLFITKIPAGSPAYQMKYNGLNSELSHEQEYVLPRNTQFKINGHSDGGLMGVDHMWHVEAIPPANPYVGQNYTSSNQTHTSAKGQSCQYCPAKATKNISGENASIAVCDVHVGKAMGNAGKVNSIKSLAFFVRKSDSWGQNMNELQDEFNPQRLDAQTYPHPVTGSEIKFGEEYRVAQPGDAFPKQPSGFREGPPVFNVNDYGEGKMGQFQRGIRQDPIQHVYRGMGLDEYNQAQKRGFFQSDERGAIIPGWEGTNAAVDPRTARYYLPDNSPGVIVKLPVKPEHNWFTSDADNYLRTRTPIPFNDVTHVSPIYHGHLPTDQRIPGSANENVGTDQNSMTTISFFVRRSSTWDGSAGDLSLNYTPPSRRGQDHRVDATLDGQPAGYMTFDNGHGKIPQGLINMVSVKPQYRGLGIAREMGNHFQNQTGISPVHSDIQTGNGIGFTQGTPEWPQWTGRGLIPGTPKSSAFFVRGSNTLSQSS